MYPPQVSVGQMTCSRSGREGRRLQLRFRLLCPQQAALITKHVCRCARAAGLDPSWRGPRRPGPLALLPKARSKACSLRLLSVPLTTWTPDPRVKERLLSRGTQPHLRRHNGLGDSHCVSSDEHGTISGWGWDWISAGKATSFVLGGADGLRAGGFLL